MYKPRYKYNKKTEKFVYIIKPSFIDLRSELKVQKSLLKYEPNINSTPVHILDNAIHDVIKAYKTSKTNLRKGNIKHYNLRYKKRSCTKTIVIPSETFSKTENAFAIRKLGLMKIENKKTIIKTKKDSRLNYSNGHFYLWIPTDKECSNNNQSNFISLDPGSRTFLTGYSNNKVVEYGNNVTEKLTKLHNEIDKGFTKKYIKNEELKLKD